LCSNAVAAARNVSAAVDPGDDDREQRQGEREQHEQQRVGVDATPQLERGAANPLVERAPSQGGRLASDWLLTN